MLAAADDIGMRATHILAAWGLPAQTPELLKYRENAVFKVRLADGGKAALRLHRPGYHAEAELRSELQWMDDLRRNGIAVPRPIAKLDGGLLARIDGPQPQFSDLIEWVEGQPIGETGKPLDYAAEEIARIYREVGRAMADMHAAADRWTPPTGFTRHAWDHDGLLGENPLWGRFWESAFLSPDTSAFLASLRRDVSSKLDEAGALDYGLIHADPVRENVLVDGERVTLIDFDDCGYGFRLFDLATALLRNRREVHYETIKASLIEGYRERRSLSDECLALLPLFLLLRSLTYVGWAAARPELPDVSERLSRYVRDVRELADALEGRG